MIPLVSDSAATPEAREAFEKFRQALGFVPNLVRLWAHSPPLLQALAALEMTVCASGRVSAALKELAAARTSELNSCPYCKAFHSARLAEQDLEKEKAAGLGERQLSPGLFTEEESLVLRLADEMTLQVRASPETLASVCRLFGVDGAVELMAVIAVLNLDNRMAFSAALPPDEEPPRK
jgi:uncharacterized peroxidase-related enzyme